MNINQKEIEMILNWASELNNRIFSMEERKLIEKLIRSHIDINADMQVEQLRGDVEELLRKKNLLK